MKKILKADSSDLDYEEGQAAELKVDLVDEEVETNSRHWITPKKYTGHLCKNKYRPQT